MDLSFCNDELRRLCNARTLLKARFGESGLIVERRLLTLADARTLREVTTRSPDRRRPEPKLGRFIASVCARDAGRIYFRACGLDVGDEEEFETVAHVEIFAIQQGDRG